MQSFFYYSNTTIDICVWAYNVLFLNVQYEFVTLIIAWTFFLSNWLNRKCQIITFNNHLHLSDKKKIANATQLNDFFLPSETDMNVPCLPPKQYKPLFELSHRDFCYFFLHLLIKSFFFDGIILQFAEWKMIYREKRCETDNAD
jgi:hypothetical protein